MEPDRLWSEWSTKGFYENVTWSNSKVFYGLTVLPRIEKEHLHGEVVSFGILVQLVMEGRQEEYKELFPFYKKMKFPAKLSDVVVMEEFLEKEEEILKEILNGPDLQNFDFDMSRLKETLFSL